MSSTESGPPAGDGLSAVRGTVAPPVDHAPPQASPTTLVGNSLASPSPKTSMTINRSKAVEPQDESELLPALPTINDVVTEAPPWLLSAAIHMVAVIVLGLLFIVPDRTEELLLQFDYQDDLGEDISAGSDLDLPLEMEQLDLDSAMAATEVPLIEENIVPNPLVSESPLEDKPIVEQATSIRQALSGRTPGMKQVLLSAYGGSGAPQMAVQEALKWLARFQEKNGSWSLRGKYSNGSRQENREAATALALLAFQGAGYTPNGDPKEPYTKVTRRGWKTLLEKEDKDGDFFQGAQSHARLYTQAMCTIALCELYGMTGDSKYHEPAQRAIDYCVKIQTPEGGWRYFPGNGNDLSVTGWFVMALQSARMAGLEVPSPTLNRISQYLDAVSREGGSRYAYQQSQPSRLSMSAEGLLCRQYLGWSQDDPRLHRGVEYLLDNPPSWRENERDVYYWYYATQVCHHMEGSYWRAWNRVMRELLPKNQIREGKERGSWDPRGDEWGPEGGRLYVTCLSTFMLEVYYRHLPIYQQHLLHSQN